MPKATNINATRKRHQRVKRNARGYFGNASRLYRYAKQAVARSGQFAYRDRRNRKRAFRGLWIVRINAAARDQGLTYRQLMTGLKAAGIGLDRKALADLAVTEPAAFARLAEQVKARATAPPA